MLLSGLRGITAALGRPGAPEIQERIVFGHGSTALLARSPLAGGVPRGDRRSYPYVKIKTPYKRYMSQWDDRARYYASRLSEGLPFIALRRRLFRR
jgi:hypothetical protein